MSTKYFTTNYLAQLDGSMDIPDLVPIHNSSISSVVGFGDKRPSIDSIDNQGQSVFMGAKSFDVDGTFCLFIGGKVTLYAWLSQAQFDKLRLTQGAANVAEWFRKLDLPSVRPALQSSASHGRERTETRVGFAEELS